MNELQNDRLPPGDHPGFFEKGIDFAIKMREWIKAGMPWRHPDETERLFVTHCKGGYDTLYVDGVGEVQNKVQKPCEFFNPERRAFFGWPKGMCEKCGCHVSSDPESILSMVNKPNKACPLGKWQAMIELDDPPSPAPTETKE